MENNDKKTTVPQYDKNVVKSRFFAQYWGTKTLYVGGVGKVEVGNGGWNLKHPDFFLQLKKLPKITDEEAKEIARIENFEYDTVIDIIVSDDFLELLNDIKIGKCNKFSIVDYLRSKGYAIPFMEYSVEDLVSLGWVRLS